MSEFDTMFQEGLLLLIKHQGEEVRFRGEILRGHVTVNAEASPGFKGEVNFNADNTSTIHLPVKHPITGAVLMPIPQKGETMQDEQDRFHRVTKVQLGNVAHTLSCVVSDGP